MSGKQCFKKIVFDFDGVLFDTNTIKRSAIFDATLMVTNNLSLTNNFVSYFTQYNGQPRELKISTFFKDEITHQKLIKEYEELLSERLISASPTNGALDFLSFLDGLDVELFILSGGSKVEIIQLLDRFHLEGYFQNILTGPSEKITNAKKHLNDGNVLMIGDSMIDYEVSQEMGWDFYFMTDYSEVKKEDEPKNAKKVTNLKELYEKIKDWN
jgi:phosphoglycolate phosphatase-like HAD superfamily hydrolase